MKKRGVKLLIGALTLVSLLGGVSVGVKAETYGESGNIYYQDWESDKMTEHMNKRIEEETGHKVYASFEDYLKEIGAGSGNNSNNDNTTKPTTPTTPKKETAKPKPCEHTYESKVVREATCAEEGFRVYYCTKCDDDYTEDIEKTSDHKYEESILIEASCTQEGQKVYTCSVCEDTYTEAIPVKGHDYNTEVSIEPGCDTVGEEKSVCSMCGDVITKALPALGHSEGEWTITKEASMFRDGQQVKNCMVCNEQLAVEVISSTYPIYYLYTVIGVVAALIIIAIAITVVKRKRQ